MIKALTLLNTLIIGFAAIAWTGTGESSDPFLTDREIPLDIVGACASIPAAAGKTCDLSAFHRHWVAKTPRGDLFILTHETCRGHDCRAWLVEKSETSATTLISVAADYRLHQDGPGYPLIESYEAGSATEGTYHRYEWANGAYSRTASRQVYRVDGLECGTSEECRLAAGEALTQRQIDRAVRIWEKVSGVSWI